MRNPRAFLHPALQLLILLLVLVAASMPAEAVVPVPGTLPVISFIPINNGPDDQYDPHVSGDWAFYTSSSASPTVRYFNFISNADVEVPRPNDSFADLLPDVSGSKATFTRVFGDRTSIMLFDLATAIAIEIDPSAGSSRLGSAIGNNTLAYIDESLGQKLVIHDLATSTSSRVIFDNLYDDSPSVSPDGNVVVWRHFSSLANSNIWQAVKSGNGWTVSAVSNSTPKYNSDTNGSLVVYEDYRSGTGHIYWKPVAGGSETQLELAGEQRIPRIAGQYIAFEGRLGGVGDLFVYDIVTNRLYQITNSPLVEENVNDIAVLPDGRIRMVWLAFDGLGAEPNVYGATFSLPSVCTPPTIAVSVAPSALWPPNNKLVDVHATVTVGGTCDPSFVLTSITPSCAGDPAKPDVVDAAFGSPDLDFKLRAGKCSSQDRVYTVVYTATNSAGISASASATVTVPHDRSGHGSIASIHGIDPQALRTHGVTVMVGTIPGDLAGDPGEPVDQALSGPRPRTGMLFDARNVDTRQVYLGNSSTLVAPTQTWFADADGDGYDDLIASYTGSEYQALLAAPVTVDDPVMLYYRTTRGMGYEVHELIAGDVPIDIVRFLETAGAARAPATGNDLQASVTEFSGIHPNPVPAEALMGFTLARPERVELAVYDVRGARVRTLESGFVAGGRHEVSWDGRNDGGRRLTSGMYFVRFTAGGYARTIKTALLP